MVGFNDALDCKTDLVREIVEFPSSAHDDILDTIADQMQNRDGGVNYDVIPDAESEGKQKGWQTPNTGLPDLDGLITQAQRAWDQSSGMNEHYDRMTGL